MSNASRSGMTRGCPLSPRHRTRHSPALSRVSPSLMPAPRSMSSGLTIISSPVSTQLDDDASARQCIEAAIARRKDAFALSHVFWTADYGYIVKFHLGAVEVVRTAVEMLVFEEPWRITRMLDGVRLTFNALALV